MSGGVGPTPQRLRRRSLSFRQLYTLAIATVLFLSNTVPLNDLLFFLFSLVYTYFMSSFAFPLRSSSPHPPIIGPTSMLFKAYFNLSILIGVLLPIGYILHGVLVDDTESIQAAAPHLFLLCCQGFMEGVFFGPEFSLPMRAFVPVFYHGRRLASIMDWVKYEFAKDGTSSAIVSARGLAVANMVFWGYNLFGLLLPIYLPKALERYYQGMVKNVSD